MKVTVTLFKPSGKYYTTEEWTVPLYIRVVSKGDGIRLREILIPDDMRYSPDFRRINGGPVLIDSQEPWGYPHLFPGTNEDVDARIPEETAE